MISERSNVILIFLADVYDKMYIKNISYLNLPFRRKREENKKHIEQSVKERQKVCFISSNDGLGV